MTRRGFPAVLAFEATAKSEEAGAGAARVGGARSLGGVRCDTRGRALTQN